MDSNSSTATVSAEAPKQPPRRGIFGLAHDLTLASIGIAGVLGEEAQALYQRSVERGGGTVKRVRERLKPAQRPRRRSARPAGRRSRRSQQAQAEWEAALARLNVPTTADVKALTQQIVELEAKIDQLNR